VATIHYLLAKSFDRASANSFISDLLDQVDVGPASTLLVRRALSLGLRDTEDALQVAVAEALAADVIVTRNGRALIGVRVHPPKSSGSSDHPKLGDFICTFEHIAGKAHGARLFSRGALRNAEI